jgi:predicted ATPase/class 3 adenylate cyclase
MGVPVTGDGDRGVRELPIGTITMLFTDIEGSTALLSRLGEAYGEALSAQRAMMRAAITASGGREMGTEGDSFFVVFSSAADAVRCCVDAQRALAAYDWPGGVAVRIRMGVHAGEPARHEDGYIGIDVHRAARITATAYGGQVVLSEIAWQLAGPGMPAGVGVRDLGFHRLKDIAEPEHIYQLTGPGLAAEFPPLKSLGAQTNLPEPATPLVGRDEDLEQLCAAIARPGIRLLTLTGTGGVGKTRLALAAATALGGAFPHGVYFVALAAVTDADVIWKTIADSLDAVGGGSGDVTGHLADRKALLVLDNLEQLEGAAEVVASLLDAAPRLMVLATSRRPLHLQREHELPVMPLDIPDEADAEDVTASGAVRLFVQQARLVKPSFAATAANAADIAAICRRLDGLPLAIELAASQVKLLSPKAILARLGHSLSLAAAETGRPQRQQSLRTTIAWTYELLRPELAEIFRRAGVFAGGCDLEALAAVAVVQGESDLLALVAELLDFSLVTVTEGASGEPRVGMLETLREYAIERLAQAGEEEDTRRRHAAHYAQVAEQAHEQLDGAGQLAALDRLETEYDNLRAALTWSLGTPAAGSASDGGRAAIGLQLVQALTMFWYQHGHGIEGRRWLERAMEVVAEDVGAPLARVAHGLGILLDEQGEYGLARQFFERSLAIWRDLGDRDQQAKDLNSLSIVHRHLGDPDMARALLEEGIAVAREIGNNFRLAAALCNLGQLESAAGNFDRATQVLREALALDQKQGEVFGEAIDQQSLAVISLRAGRAQDGRDPLAEVIGYVAGAGGEVLAADALEISAAITADLGDGPMAARLTGAADAVRLRLGAPRTPSDTDLLERYLAPARAAVAREAWDAELAAGRALTEQQALALLIAQAPSREG